MIRNVVLAVGAALLASGCGGDDGKTTSNTQTLAETREEVSAVFVELSRTFGDRLGPILTQLKDESPSAALSREAREDLNAAAGPLARELRDGADRLSALNPPQPARRAVRRFAEVVRDRASRLEELASREGVTVRDVRDLARPPTDVLRGLAEAGLGGAQ